MFFLKNLSILFIFIFISNCTEKIYFSGTIINENVNYNEFTSKKELINELGYPNYIDLIEGKYYYYNEVNKKNNIFKREILSRLILVFSIKDESIISINEYNLSDNKNLKIQNNKTENNLIETGIIKKIFGGVSPSNMTNSP